MTWAAIQSIVNYYYSLAKSSLVKQKKYKEENGLTTTTSLAVEATPATSATSTEVKNKKFLILPNSKIGNGGTSVIKVAINQNTGKEVAAKIIDYKNYTSKQVDRLLREIEIMHELSKSKYHDRFVKLYKVEDNNEDGEVHVFMEYIRGVNLLECFFEGTSKQGVSEDVVRPLFHQIISSVSALHTMNISHGDIKLENILLDENFNVRIIDFGFANHTVSPKTNQPQLMSDYVGTAQYASPEILLNIPFDGKKADSWALGVVLYALLTGKFPFSGSSRSISKRTTPEYVNTLLVDKPFSDEAKHLIQSLLELDPSARLLPSEALLHPFFHSTDCSA
jgi:5'-AMP-activated protein kinase, catalytic alpha subunit